MKRTLIAASLFAVTATVVAFYPTARSTGAVNPPPADPPVVQSPAVDPASGERSRVDVVFALDTTGSMGGLIQAAKEKIWSIATTMAQAQPAPVIRMGLVAYRDRGDAYVTRRVDLSEDLDSVYARLMELQASGGGDGPESVNQALHDAVHRMAWSQDPQAYKVVFLVGDAPPHRDYPDDVQYPDTLVVAGQKGIVVNAVQCGALPETASEWRQIAQLGQGRAFQVEQGGSAVAIATPFDARLAELSARLDGTRLYYGSAEDKAVQARKLAAAEALHASASVASRARRATFNASASGEANLLGKGELVDDVASGRVDLSRIERDRLPAPLQALAPAEQRRVLEEKAAERQAVKSQIQDLVEQRAGFLERKVTELGGAKDSLDEKIYGAVREQAAARGLRYEASAPSY